MLGMTNAENTVTSLTNIICQPVAIATIGVYGTSTAPFWSCLAAKLVDICQVTTGGDIGSTSACVWLWSEGAYWSVRKFDLILAILSVLTSDAARHLLLFSE